MGKLSALPQDSSPTGDDYTVTVDTSSGQTKKVLLSSILGSALIGASGLDFTSFDVYSTSETDTGRIWVDARPIYRKVLRGNVTIVSGVASIAHGITGMTTSFELIRVDGGIKLGATSGAYMQTILYHETSGLFATPSSIDGTNVSWTATYAWGLSKYTLILEYAK